MKEKVMEHGHSTLTTRDTHSRSPRGFMASATHSDLAHLGSLFVSKTATVLQAWKASLSMQQ